MNRYSERRNLKLELIQAENLLNLAGDHPFMAPGLKSKVQRLKEALDNFPEEIIEPKIAILFSGNATIGSSGIKSSFVSKILNPIQEMIKTQTAEIKFKKIGSRGKVKGADDSELFLIALPTGSFGVELAQLNASDLFSDVEVAEAINQVSDIISKTTESDEGFAEVVNDVPLRTLNNLKTLLKEVSEEDSIIKIQTDTKEIEIEKDNVKLGYQRIINANESEELIKVDGILKGLLLESNKFEFLTSEGEKISGRISEDISEEEIAAFGRDYLNEQCTVSLVKMTVKIAGGKPSIGYTLNNIQQE